MNLQRLTESVKKHEGFRSKPYVDTTGHLTIGVGRNLDNGISENEADFLLQNDLAEATTGARSIVSNFNALSDQRQEVLVEMCFNLGASKLGQFHLMIAALEAGEWEMAAKEMLDSTWAKQVKIRATELSEQMRLG